SSAAFVGFRSLMQAAAFFLWFVHFAGLDQYAAIQMAATYGVKSIFFASLAPFMVWLFGLILFASVPWWLLHKLGQRDWLTAVLLGIVLTVAVWFLVVPGISFQAGTIRAVAESALRFAAAGAIVGFIVWRVAYRRSV